jgi:CubicO group peptidase (beta-lactamase class C family)
MAPEYMKWRAFRGEAPGTRGMALKDRVSLPLLYEPGTSWSYGISTDLAGELVGRLNNTTLEEFMEKNIWTPLGIKNITSHQERKPDVKKNLVKMTSRGVVENAALGFAARTEAKVEWTDEPVYDDPTVDEYGGAGGIGSAVEYIKILDSILADDGKLLKSETIDLALTPQLTGGAEQAVNGFLGAPFSAGAFSSKKPGTKFNYGLAGGLVMDDVKGSLRSRTMTWSGLPNLLWTIDRKAGLTLFYASNILPFGDYKSAEFQQLFEKEIYARFERSKVAT